MKTKIDIPDFAFHLDPGFAPVEVLQEVFASLSNLFTAQAEAIGAKGFFLEFSVDTEGTGKIIAKPKTLDPV